jgi:predicted nucleotidyltransferase
MGLSRHFSEIDLTILTSLEAKRKKEYDQAKKPDVVKGCSMKPSIALEHNRKIIREIVARHHALNARVFGSVLRGSDDDDSDIDILVDPTPDTTMLDIGAIRHQLRAILGVEVDVLTPNALPESFRQKVLKEAIPV